jgi:hypothetical protein
VGLRGACPKWESVDVAHHGHDDHVHKVCCKTPILRKIIIQ